MMHRLDKLPRKGRLYSVGKIDGKTRILDLGIHRKVHYGEFPNVKRLQERGLFHDKHPYKRYSRYKLFRRVPLHSVSVYPPFPLSLKR